MAKTLRSFFAFVCLICMLLTGCSGYNGIIRKHLENPNNYSRYQAELTAIYYYDPDSNRKISDYSEPDFFEHDVIFEVVFSDYDDVRPFVGASPNTDIPLDEYKIQLTVLKENNQILFENGFYDAVVLNTTIDVMTSSYIYMDGNFFYVASVVYGETEYLNFEEGLSGIVEMVNQDMSLF